MSILVISDTHLPHEHPKALDFCARLRDKHKPETVIHIGDLYDWHSASFHSHDPDLLSPKDELELGAKHAARWHKEFPKMSIVRGNHDAIPARKLFEAGLPEAMLKSLNDMYQTPGWTWRDEIIIPGGRHKYWFKHHWAPAVVNRGGDGGYSVIAGHLHSKAQIIWSQYPSHSTFSLIVGCLINPNSRAFAYNKHDARRPVLACATIEHGEPSIHRMF